MKRNKFISADLAFCALAGIAVLMYLSRIRMGMADLDESFYLTIPYRLAQGDALLADEWHVSQLSGFLTYPLMKLYLALFGSTEGIVLNFRYVYLFAQTAVAAAGYLILRNRYRWMAVWVSLVYLLFTPFGIKALSYNTMGLMAVYLFVLPGISDVGQTDAARVAMGLALAAAVLCNPYLVVLYAVIVLLTLLCLAGRKIFGKRGRAAEFVQRAAESFSLRKLVFLTAGAGILFILFAGFELSRVSLGEILDSFPFVVSDSAHRAKGLKSIVSAFIYYVNQYPVYGVIWAACTAVGIIRKRSSELMLWLISVASAGMALYFSLFLTNKIGYAAMMLPLTFAGLSAFLFTEKRQYRLLGGWLVGLLYGFCMSASSNNGIYTFANACTVSACVSLLMIGDYVNRKAAQRPGRESRGGRAKGAGIRGLAGELPGISLALLIAVQLFAEGHVLMQHIFWEAGPKTLTDRVEAGPLAGLYTTQAKRERYERNYENVLQLGKVEGENVIFYCRFPCGYLILDDWRNGGCSAWLADSVANPGDERMREYAARHPEKRADVIYVDEQSVGVWTEEEWQSFCRENGYRMERFESGAIGLIRE